MRPSGDGCAPAVPDSQLEEQRLDECSKRVSHANRPSTQDFADDKERCEKTGQNKYAILIAVHIGYIFIGRYPRTIQSSTCNAMGHWRCTAHRSRRTRDSEPQQGIMHYENAAVSWCTSVIPRPVVWKGLHAQTLQQKATLRMPKKSAKPSDAYSIHPDPAYKNTDCREYAHKPTAAWP